MIGLALFLLAFALLTIGLLIPTLRARSQRARIMAHLAKLGARHIEVRHRLFDLDDADFTFDVSYRDGAGRAHRTLCRVTSDWWAEPALCWDEVPQRAVIAATKQRRSAALLKGGGVESRGDLEQFMSDLIAENARLRAILQESKVAG